MKVSSIHGVLGIHKYTVYTFILNDECNTKNILRQEINYYRHTKYKLLLRTERVVEVWRFLVARIRKNVSSTTRCQIRSGSSSFESARRDKSNGIWLEAVACL